MRIDYQGGPALLLTLVEMGPRSMPASLPARSGRPTAWETLDSLGEGIITTDVSGRIVNGSMVNPGDLLVQFDGSTLQRTIQEKQS